MQKLLRAGKVVIDPNRKATTPVTAAIVIDGPACFNPILNRSFGCMSIGTKSILLTITNISSTPIPTMRNGIML